MYMICLTSRGEAPAEGRYLFMGDSVTDDGRFIAYLEAFLKIYKAGGVELINAGVSSETASGLSERAHPFPRPCAAGRIDRVISLAQPDFVILAYGVNDAIYAPFSEERYDAYLAGLAALMRKIHDAGAKAVVLTPFPFDAQSYGGALADDGDDDYSYMRPYKNYAGVLDEYARRIAADLADEADLVVDITTPLEEFTASARASDPSYKSGDGIHPNEAAHRFLAVLLADRLFGARCPRFEERLATDEGKRTYDAARAYERAAHRYWKEHIGHDNPSKEQPVSQDDVRTANTALDETAAEMADSFDIRGSYGEYSRLDFTFGGHEAVIVKPKRGYADNKWIWRAEFLGAFDAVDSELLARGYSLLYYSISDMYGSDGAVALMEPFRAYAVERFGLSQKTILFGFSRGGLYSLAYTAAHPHNVAALYLDAPVVSVSSWPLGTRSGAGSPREAVECALRLGITRENAEAYDEKTTAARLAKIGAARVPLALVAGDSDRVVPYIENGIELEQYYKINGLRLLCIIKPGCDHHPHSLEDPSPVADFLENNAIY